MSLTRDQLVERVRHLLFDFPAPASATETGDDVTTTWILPDRYVDETRLSVYMTPSGGTPVVVTGDSAIYSFSPDSSAVVFTSPPSSGTVLDFTYWYHHWQTEDVIWALVDAVYDLAPNFYVTATLQITPTGAKTYAITDPSGEPPIYVRRVSLAEDSETYERLPRSYWRIDRGALDAATLVFFEEQSSGLIEVEYTVRPRPFAAGDDTLADLGLPERVQRAIVLHATWTLLEQRINPRMRSDIAVVTQGEGVPTPSQLLQHSARVKALLDLELQRQRMRPQTAVGI